MVKLYIRGLRKRRRFVGLKKNGKFEFRRHMHETEAQTAADQSSKTTASMARLNKRRRPLSSPQR
jgi:hypothetical protein